MVIHAKSRYHATGNIPNLHASQNLSENAGTQVESKGPYVYGNSSIKIILYYARHDTTPYTTYKRILHKNKSKIGQHKNVMKHHVLFGITNQ